ncbi:unnamed protein product [Arctia plantaginis]|uniref:Uncharacterized protein n=1 Tax=Arctia plantaginis TaxID=874455 RepID=A0A8S1BIZ2_ARCPL|nr:unnamed protein product [Arctia plantaginis]
MISVCFVPILLYLFQVHLCRLANYPAQLELGNKYTLSRLTESEEYGPGLRTNLKYIMQNESDLPLELIKNVRYVPVKRTQNAVVKEYATSTTGSTFADSLRIAREKQARELRREAASGQRIVQPLRSYLRPDRRQLQVLVDEDNDHTTRNNRPPVRNAPAQPGNKTQAANQPTTNQPPLPPSPTPANPPLPPASTSAAPVARTAQSIPWYNLPPPLPPSIEVRSPLSPSPTPASPSLLPAYSGGAWPARAAQPTAWYNLPPPLPPSDEVKPPLAPSPTPTSPPLPPAYTGRAWLTRNPQPPIWYLMPTHDSNDLPPLSASDEQKPPLPPSTTNAPWPAKRKREQDVNNELENENNKKIRK